MLRLVSGWYFYNFQLTLYLAHKNVLKHRYERVKRRSSRRRSSLAVSGPLHSELIRVVDIEQFEECAHIKLVLWLPGRCAGARSDGWPVDGASVGSGSCMDRAGCRTEGSMSSTSALMDTHCPAQWCVTLPAPGRECAGSPRRPSSAVSTQYEQ